MVAIMSYFEHVRTVNVVAQNMSFHWNNSQTKGSKYHEKLSASQYDWARN